MREAICSSILTHNSTRKRKGVTKQENDMLQVLISDPECLNDSMHTSTGKKKVAQTNQLYAEILLLETAAQYLSFIYNAFAAEYECHKFFY